MPTLAITLANKPALLLDALMSVARQTRRDVQHVVEFDCGQYGAGIYPPAVAFNRIVSERSRPDDYVAWLSDDDVWEPTYVEQLAGYLDTHPDVGACYGGTRIVAYEPGQPERPIRDIPAERAFTVGAWPSCQIDGGQVLVRRSVLNRLAAPWVPETLADCHTSDGSFLNRVASVTPIVPVVGSWVMRNRQTPESAHWRLVDGQPTFSAPETVERLRGGGDACQGVD